MEDFRKIDLKRENMLPCNVITLCFPFKQMYFNKLGHLVISAIIIINFRNQGYSTAQFTQWFDLKHEIPKISNTCKVSIAR